RSRGRGARGSRRRSRPTPSSISRNPRGPRSATGACTSSPPTSARWCQGRSIPRAGAPCSRPNRSSGGGPRSLVHAAQLRSLEPHAPHQSLLIEEDGGDIFLRRRGRERLGGSAVEDDDAGARAQSSKPPDSSRYLTPWSVRKKSM